MLHYSVKNRIQWRICKYYIKWEFKYCLKFKIFWIKIFQTIMKFSKKFFLIILKEKNILNIKTCFFLLYELWKALKFHLKKIQKLSVYFQKLSGFYSPRVNIFLFFMKKNIFIFSKKHEISCYFFIWKHVKMFYFIFFKY